MIRFLEWWALSQLFFKLTGHYLEKFSSIVRQLASRGRRWVNNQEIKPLHYCSIAVHTVSTTQQSTRSTAIWRGRREWQCKPEALADNVTGHANACLHLLKVHSLKAHMYGTYCTDKANTYRNTTPSLSGANIVYSFIRQSLNSFWVSLISQAPQRNSEF